MIKEILTLFLIISASLLLYPLIKSYLYLSNSGLPVSEAQNQLMYQIIGFFVLFFVVFCVIWAIPEDKNESEVYENSIEEHEKMVERGYHFNLGTNKWEKEQERTEKEQIDFKEENVEEMIKKGYVLDMKTGKWEKP